MRPLTVETGNSIADTITKELHSFSGADRSWATCHIVVSFYASGQRSRNDPGTRNPHVASYFGGITWRGYGRSTTGQGGIEIRQVRGEQTIDW